MTRAHELEVAVRSAGFTPSVTHVPRLFELLAKGDRDLARDVERALLRLGAALVPLAIARASNSPAKLRARIVRLLGNRPEEAVREFLFRATGDDDPKTRRNAVRALGKWRTPEVEARLLALWEADLPIEDRRVLAAALGKIGSERALASLSTAETDDPELSRILGRATVSVSRTSRRGEPSHIDATRSLGRPRPVVFVCREGLEPILAEELEDDFRARVVGPGRVAATLDGPLERVFSSRTWLRVAFPIATRKVADGEDLALAIAHALSSPEAREIFSAFTQGTIRFRLDWAGGGHRRAVVWRCAELVAKIAPELVNDPTESTWEVVVLARGGEIGLELAPRALVDPRFAYRVGDVPAASHPTIAAALAYVAGSRPSDVVWDPFVGSGTELVERARRGPFRALHGTDTDPRALAIARKNLAAAGITGATLVEADALSYAPPGVSLILSNPPMGRRLLRGEDHARLLDRFVEHAARVLSPGGALVWISPNPSLSRKKAASVGLELELDQRIDMGGFQAEMQRWRAPSRR